MGIIKNLSVMKKNRISQFIKITCNFLVFIMFVSFGACQASKAKQEQKEKDGLFNELKGKATKPDGTKYTDDELKKLSLADIKNLKNKPPTKPITKGDDDDEEHEITPEMKEIINGLEGKDKATGGGKYSKKELEKLSEEDLKLLKTEYEQSVTTKERAKIINILKKEYPEEDLKKLDLDTLKAKKTTFLNDAKLRGKYIGLLQGNKVPGDPSTTFGDDDLDGTNEELQELSENYTNYRKNINFLKKQVNLIDEVDTSAEDRDEDNKYEEEELEKMTENELQGYISKHKKYAEERQSMMRALRRKPKSDGSKDKYSSKELKEMGYGRLLVAFEGEQKRVAIDFINIKIGKSDLDYDSPDITEGSKEVLLAIMKENQGRMPSSLLKYPYLQARAKEDVNEKTKGYMIKDMFKGKGLDTDSEKDAGPAELETALRSWQKENKNGVLNLRKSVLWKVSDSNPDAKFFKAVGRGLYQFGKSFTATSLDVNEGLADVVKKDKYDLEEMGLRANIAMALGFKIPASPIRLILFRAKTNELVKKKQKELTGTSGFIVDATFRERVVALKEPLVKSIIKEFGGDPVFESEFLNSIPIDDYEAVYEILCGKKFWQLLFNKLKDNKFETDLYRSDVRSDSDWVKRVKEEYKTKYNIKPKEEDDSDDETEE